MVNPQLVEFIRTQLGTGESHESIRASLMSSRGWNIVDINEAFRVAGVAPPPPSAPALPNIPGADVIAPPAPAPSVPSVAMPPSPPAENIPQTMPAAPFLPPTVKYAGFWMRLLATLVDNIVIAIPLLLIVWLLKLTQVTYIPIIFLVMSWLYLIVTTYVSGATLGKALLGLKVESVGLDKLTLSQVIMRETVGKLLSGITLGIGFIMEAFTANKQGLHDKLVKSVVTYNDPTAIHFGRVIMAMLIVIVVPALVGLAATTLALGSIFSSLKLSPITSTATSETSLSSLILGMSSLADTYATGHKDTYSYAKACDSGMFADNDLRSAVQALKGHSPICYAENTSYAISAKLEDSIKSFCVDSTGYAGGGSARDDGTRASCKPDTTGYGLLPGTF